MPRIDDALMATASQNSVRIKHFFYSSSRFEPFSTWHIWTCVLIQKCMWEESYLYPPKRWILQLLKGTDNSLKWTNRFYVRSSRKTPKRSESNLWKASGLKDITPHLCKEMKTALDYTESVRNLFRSSKYLIFLMLCPLLEPKQSHKAILDGTRHAWRLSIKSQGD